MQDWEVMTALEKYHAIRKSYKKLRDKEDAINAKRFKVGGSIISVPENPERKEVTIIRNMSEHDKIVQELEQVGYMKVLADMFIASLAEPYRSMVEDKYVKGADSKYLTERYHYERHQIQRIIDKLVSKFVEEC